MTAVVEMASNMLVAYFGYPSSLPPVPWDATIGSMAAATGLPLDQFKYTFALLSGIPIGFAFQALTKDPWSLTEPERKGMILFRHMLCAAVGFSLILLVFGWETFHTLFSSTVAFILMRILPRSQVHIFVSIWAMSYMSCAHFYRMIVDYGAP